MPEQDNRPAVYLEGNTSIYRASALGHCIRMLWAARSGMDRRPIPAAIQSAMDRGTELEPIILEKLFTDHDFTFAYGGQQFQVELDVGTWNGIRCVVRGKMDERGHQASNPLYGDLPIDVKAFGQRLVDEYRTKGLNALPGYAWQQSVYGHGSGTTHFLMPIYNKDTEKIEEWTLEPIPVPYSFEAIRNRIMTVEEMFAEGNMPTECPADYACQYPYLHDTKLVDTLPEGTEVMLRARIALDKKIDGFTKAKDILNKALKGKLPSDVLYHLDVEDEGTYSISVIANPDRFNTAAAKALLTEANVDWQNDPDFIIPGEGVQLRVNKPKKGKGE